MLNLAVAMGRIVHDPELRTTGSGISVLSFTIAVDRDYVPKGEDRQADFLDCVAWRQTAEFINKYFHKGSMIVVQGTNQSRNYEDRNGNKRTAKEIVVSNAWFCGGKEEPKETAYTGEGDFEEVPDGSDMLPF